MTWLVYVPLALPALLVPIAWRLTRATDAQAAARALAACTVGTAVTGAGSLALIILTLIDDIPAMERREASARSAGVVLPEPVPDAVATVATVLAAVALWRVIAELRRRRAAVRELRAAGAPHGGLLVADWERPHAVAVPRQGHGERRRPGYVVVTSGLLRLLDPNERAAVLAHERAHLRFQHHRLTTAAGIAAAAHPLLRPAADAVALLVERAADEDAAAIVGDRRLVARAVARVALAGRDAGQGPAGAPGVAGALGIGGSSLVRRVDALTGASCGAGRGWSGLAGAVLLAAVLATGGAVDDFVRVAAAWWP